VTKTSPRLGLDTSSKTQAQASRAVSPLAVIKLSIRLDAVRSTVQVLVAVLLVVICYSSKTGNQRTEARARRGRINPCPLPSTSATTTKPAENDGWVKLRAAWQVHTGCRASRSEEAKRKWWLAGSCWAQVEAKALVSNKVGSTRALILMAFIDVQTHVFLPNHAINQLIPWLGVCDKASPP
jgi:hypothetical protein